MLGSKDDRKFFARDRSDRISMLEMLARRSKLELTQAKQKIFALLSCENQKNLCFSYQYQKLVQKFSNQLKYLPKVGVVSRFSSIMLEICLILLEKCSVLLKKCSVLLENFFKTYARDRSVIARNFLMLEMLDHFLARDRSDRKFKIQNCARDRSARKIQCSKCSRSMFLALGLNSSSPTLDVQGQHDKTLAV